MVNMILPLENKTMVSSLESQMGASKACPPILLLQNNHRAQEIQ